MLLVFALSVLFAAGCGRLPNNDHRNDNLGNNNLNNDHRNNNLGNNNLGNDNLGNDHRNDNLGNNNLGNNNLGNNNLGNNAANRSYRVYFADENHSRLMSEERTYNADYSTRNVVEMAKETLNSLIEGPKNTAHKAVLSNSAMVKNVTLENGGVLRVDFDKDFLKGYDKLNAREEMTVYSIVNSLAEYPEVNKVVLTVDGKPLKLGTTEYNEPLTKNMLL